MGNKQTFKIFRHHGKKKQIEDKSKSETQRSISDLSTKLGYRVGRGSHVSYVALKREWEAEEA